MGTTGKLDIRHECPSVEQYLALREEAGLSAMSVEGAAIGLPRSISAASGNSFILYRTRLMSV
ncbi:hypothetical protein [Paenibacillus pseudetheri]|uniref:Uncharacterized protein n=1 Tax=Paenibacillus pseudetheri TaxID=2897682 RepID=A0ABM9BAB7_9BACL|nr:hypothetical protein [Paenibacillus pseudetheri]CAH1055316.1 hypothetical protein PAECIP111894_01468 [Paenibacillus pseudetheri]